MPLHPALNTTVHGVDHRCYLYIFINISIYMYISGLNWSELVKGLQMDRYGLA